MKKLSIIITTYNRSTELVEQLHTIKKQGHINEYEIIISDNCSNYDVEKHLDDNFDGDFRDNISVYRRNINVGSALNVAMSFGLCKTPWMWLLSDDDFTLDGSLGCILKDIEDNKDICYLKYSIEGCKLHDCVYIKDLLELTRYYELDGYSWGDLIFMSNGVFNMIILNSYIEQTIQFAHNYIPQIVPIFICLQKELHPMRMMSPAIVRFRLNNTSYDNITAAFAFFNLVFDLRLNAAQIAGFKRIFRRPRFYFPRLLYNNVSDKTLRRIMYQTYFIHYYSLLNPLDVICGAFFLISDRLNVPLKKINYFLRRMNNMIKNI